LKALITLLLVAAAALIALALHWSRAEKRPPPRAARERNPKYPPDDYHCVELRHRRDACDAVKRIGGMRFLAGEAPEIPLPGCDTAKCFCRYVHHADRRNSDRRNPYPLQASAPPASGDRRTKRDRRRPAKPPFGPKSGR
jgi:hypothetical protein